MHVSSHKKRPPLHRQEAWLLGVLATLLVYSPWAFGMTGWVSQVIAVTLAIAAMVLSLWPRSYSDEFSPEGAFRLAMWPRLLRFPPFWLGLGLLLLLVVQWCNPAWIWQQNERMWWMKQIPHIGWLPSGTRTGFEWFNLWRTFLVYATTWMTICAIWVGVTRRRTLQILLMILLANAAVLAVVGLVHRMMAEPKVLWIRVFKDASSFSSFVYQNHAGAYFSLMAAAALALGVWHFFEGRKRMARSTPSAFWVLVSGLLVFAVVFSLSRGAMITLAVFFVLAALAVMIVRSANPVPSTTPKTVAVALLLMFAATCAVVVQNSDFRAIEGKFSELTRKKTNDPSIAGRIQVRQAATDMLRENWVLGTGAASFRFIFPKYLQHYPAVWDGSLWEHAHIDWLQVPIELGAAGVLLLLGAAGWLVYRFWQLRGWRHGLAAIVFVGSTQTLLHAVGDFPFQNPAILLAWWSLLAIALRWLEIDMMAEAKMAQVAHKPE